MCNQCFKLIKNQFGPMDNLHSKSLALALDSIKCPAMAKLELLTPGGSEYYEDPDACYAVIRDTRINLWEELKKRQIKINEFTRKASDMIYGKPGPLASAPTDWKVGLSKEDLQLLVSAINSDLLKIRRTCGHCLDEYVGTAFSICTNCGRFQ